MFASVAARFRSWSGSLSPDTRQNVRSAVQGAQFLGICYCVDRYVFHFSMTHGPSMMPTLNEMGDVVIVDKCSTLWNPIRRNDIVIADSMNKKDVIVCKRVIALPGDSVHQRHWRWPVKIPEGHVWLEGDNPKDSIDSRYYGPVPLANVKGRVCARIWPLTQMQWLHRSSGRPRSNSIYFDAMVRDTEIVQLAQETLEWESHRQRALDDTFVHWEHASSSSTPVTQASMVLPSSSSESSSASSSPLVPDGDAIMQPSYDDTAAAAAAATAGAAVDTAVIVYRKTGSLPPVDAFSAAAADNPVTAATYNNPTNNPTNNHASTVPHLVVRNLLPQQQQLS